MKSPASWIERHATFAPDKIALRCGEEALTYAALAARVAGTSAWLSGECALAAGARVAWLGYNGIDLVVLLLACAHARLVLVPLNWRLSAEELDAVLDDAGAALLIVDASCRELGGALRPRPAASCGFAAAGLREFPRSPDGGALRDVDADPATPLMLVYTSGTTGRPKGAVLTRETVLFNALNACHMHDMTAHDRVLTVLPMFHVGGLNIQTLPALYCGAEVVIEPRFEPGRTLEMIARLRPSLIVLVPATIAALFAEPAWPHTDLGCLRCITTGSTDVPRALIEALHVRGVPVIQVYGATETGPVAIYQRIDEAHATVGAIGRCGLHTEVRLVDAQGHDVADGVPGEVWLRGPHLAHGYWNAQAGRADPFPDGWFASGDVAERDARGLFHFKDRIKHVIISGGENIYPAELERVLAASGVLREAAVAGRPDPRWGEVPVVVAVRGDAALARDDVLALFDDHLARYKRPRDVVFVDALPRNAMGKVEVPRLREIVRDG